MKKTIIFSLILMILTACQPSITEEQAIEIALTEIHGFVEIPEGTTAEVNYTDNRIIVTFPIPEDLLLRADYYAQVFINRSDKQVIGVLVGS